MTINDQGSMTLWLGALKAGDLAAALPPTGLLATDGDAQAGADPTLSDPEQTS